MADDLRAQRRRQVHPGQSGDRNASLSGNRGAVRAGRAPHEACGASRRMAVLSQRVHTEYDFSVEQVVALGRYAHRKSFLRSGDPEGEAHIDRGLAAVGLTDKRTARLSELSGGEVQRAFLAQVFAQDPELLVLDEPANHLDVTYQKQIFDLIDQWRQVPGRAVMAVVHDLNLARRYGTHALLLDRGHMAAAGEIGAVLTGNRLAEVYGMDVLGWLREMLRCWETPLTKN